MRLLLRMAFWLALVSLLLPSAVLRPAAPETRTSGTPTLAVNATGKDARRPSQQPDIKPGGLQAFAEFCRDFYRFLTEGGVQPDNKSASRAGKPSQDTLTRTDLMTPWHGSVPRRETVTRRSI